MAAQPPDTAFDSDGPEDAPAVVLIHGIGLDRSIWNAWMPVLARRFRVVRYDLPGHGGSAPLAETVSLSALTHQLAGLLDTLAIGRAAVVGFSIGGMINRRFAVDHPDRVAALAVLNSPHERTPDEQQAVEDRVARTNRGGPAATMDATLRRWFTPAFIEAHPDAVDRVRRGVLATHPPSYAQFREVLAKGVKELIRPSPPIAAPALVITCEHDSGSTPSMSHAIASEIEGAETIIVPHLQHLGLVEDPDAFIAPVIRFLDTVCGTGRQAEETS
jgi:3-oxoadipate enol-lactonase